MDSSISTTQEIRTYSLWQNRRILFDQGSRNPVISHFFLLSFLAMLTGCGAASSQAHLRVTGASTVYPIIEMAKDSFAQEYDIYLEAQAGGSTRGFEDTIAGRNDLGAMARDLTSKEANQVEAFPIAYDGVGIIVHQSTKQVGVTTGELQRIYRNQVDNWAELEDESQDIVVVNKADGHATLQVFMEHTGLERSEIQADVSAGDNAQVIRVVANTPGAIGYVSIGEAKEAEAIGMPIRLLALDGVEPTVASVMDQTYPMRRTLYLVSKGEPSEAANKLLDFLRSDAGEQIIIQGNYVPLP